MGKLQRNTEASALLASSLAVHTTRRPVFSPSAGITESSFFRIIPHDFGRQRPIVIDDTILLKKVMSIIIAKTWNSNIGPQELELVDALGDMVSFV